MRIQIPRQPAAVAGAILAVLVMLLLLLFVDESFLSDPDIEVGSDTELAAEQIETGKAVEKYNQWTLSENRRIFDWHSRSTKILFWTSILITITGMAFSFWQFVEASHSEESARKTEQLEVKTQLVSLAFKSRSLATFMMFISLAYLLIYVTMVYPVRPVNNDSASPVTVPTQETDPNGAPDQQDTMAPDKVDLTHDGDPKATSEEDDSQ
jgi:hypothetical protein